MRQLARIIAPDQRLGARGARLQQNPRVVPAGQLARISHKRACPSETTNAINWPAAIGWGAHRRAVSGSNDGARRHDNWARGDHDRTGCDHNRSWRHDHRRRRDHTSLWYADGLAIHHCGSRRRSKCAGSGGREARQFELKY